MSTILETVFSWATLWYILVIIYVLACAALIFVVLIQKGKGAGFAGAFGIGPGTETVFGPRGIKSGIARITYGIAGAFMVLALLLSLLTGRVGQGPAPETVAGAEDAITEQDLLLDTPAPAQAPVAVTPIDAPAETPAVETPAEMPVVEIPVVDDPVVETPTVVEVPVDAPAVEPPADLAAPVEAPEAAADDVQPAPAQ